MLDTAISSNTKTDLLIKLYNNFAEFGLDQTSMRDLCKGTGVSIGSLYYWFDDKADLVIQTALFGMEGIISKFLENDFDNLHDIKSVFYFCAEKLLELKKELRFIYQVALSPVYGERMQRESEEIISRLDNFIEGLALRFRLDYERFISVVMCFLSAVIRDVVWNDKRALDIQLEFLSACIDRL